MTEVRPGQLRRWFDDEGPWGTPFLVLESYIDPPRQFDNEVHWRCLCDGHIDTMTEAHLLRRSEVVSD